MRFQIERPPWPPLRSWWCPGQCPPPSRQVPLRLGQRPEKGRVGRRPATCHLPCRCPCCQGPCSAGSGLATGGRRHGTCGSGCRRAHREGATLKQRSEILADCCDCSGLSLLRGQRPARGIEENKHDRLNPAALAVAVRSAVGTRRFVESVTKLGAHPCVHAESCAEPSPVPLPGVITKLSLKIYVAAHDACHGAGPSISHEFHAFFSHTYTRTYIHTYIHTCIHTYIHTYLLLSVYMYVGT